MALLHTGDRICASCGGLNGRNQPACAGDEPVEVISVYSRQQAIEDGILVDCEQAPMGLGSLPIQSGEMSSSSGRPRFQPRETEL